MDLQKLEWLDPSQRPLDWHGPRDRPFVPFRPEALNRPIIENLQHVVTGHANQVAIFDSDASICFAELWEGIGRLSRIVAARSEPGQLIAILLPSTWLHPLAMLACLAAGRPFAAVDVNQPAEWI